MQTTHVLERTQEIDRPLADVFSFFADAGNLEALTPAFLKFRILTPTPIQMRPGALIEYQLSLFGIPLKWRTRIEEWVPGVRFVDVQESGPYALWRHTHTFESRGETTIMRDRVEYREPLGPLGRIAHALFVRRTLDAIFDFRHQATQARLEGTPPAA